MKISNNPAWLIAAMSVLTGCHAPPEAATANPIATVRVSPARLRSFDETLTAYGTVESSPDQMRSVTVQAETQVTEVLLSSGTAVERGQPLLRLAPSATTRLDLEKAIRDAKAAQAEAKRVERLWNQRLATNSELEAAKSAAASAAALRDSLLARIGDGMVLRAPLAGIVDGLTLRPGDVVAAGTVVARVADPAATRVRVGLEPSEAGHVVVSAPVKLSILGSNTPPIAARVSAVDPRVDPQSRVASAVIALPPAGGAAAGAAVRAIIVVGTHPNAIAVPRSAVLYAEDKPYLFLASGGKAQRREVSTGLQDDKDVEIVRGLRAGEAVITGGNYELEHGMRIQVAGAAAP